SRRRHTRSKRDWSSDVCSSDLIKDKLNEMQNEYEFELFIGLKHINPFIEDAVESMEKAGIKQAVSLVLAPHYSTFSVKAYNARAQETAYKYGITLSSRSEERRV